VSPAARALRDTVAQDAARLAGFRQPVVLTAGAWKACLPGAGPARDARLGELLALAHAKVRTARLMGKDTARFGYQPQPGTTTPPAEAELAARISPGLVTIMLAAEDWPR
jgi:hypothetical protein